MRRRLALVLVYLLLAFFAGLTLTPFAFMLASTLKSKVDFASTLFLPDGTGWLGVGWDRLTLANYERLFTKLPMARALLNSAFLASVGSIFATLFSAMGGYALSKFEFRGREALIRLVLGALIIPAPLLIAPGFQNLWQLGLLDTYAGLIVPGLAPAFGVFLFRQAMINAVPAELIDAARIDGAGEFRIVSNHITTEESTARTASTPRPERGRRGRRRLIGRGARRFSPSPRRWSGRR